MESIKEDGLAQATTLARLYFNDHEPDEQTLGQAMWLHSELMQNIAVAVQNGVARAFSK
ncbi:hypothetical protein [Thalassolituus sp.]|uniref:DUF6890 family protein n=1 Tax=Thalassolituus sp. TaxID=2030822 RepID=UPI0035598E51